MGGVRDGSVQVDAVRNLPPDQNQAGFAAWNEINNVFLQSNFIAFFHLAKGGRAYSYPFFRKEYQLSQQVWNMCFLFGN